jgi:hypothetical protein
MLLSKKSGPDIEVFPFPGPLAEVQLAVELLKAPFQSLELAPLSSGGAILGGQFFQIFPNQTGQRGVPVNRHLPELLYNFVI